MLWTRGARWQVSFVKSLGASQGATRFVLRSGLQVLGRVGGTHTPKSASISQGRGPLSLFPAPPRTPCPATSALSSRRLSVPQDNAFAAKRW